MTTTATLATCLAALAVTTSASANVVATDGVVAQHEPDAPRRLEGRVGIVMGGTDVGDADGFSFGVTAGFGYRIGDLTLRATLDHYRVGDGEMEAIVRRGRGTRVGGAVRYSFANSYDDRERNGIGLDLWGEAGVALEHVAWRQGGVLDRPSGELAIGFDFDGYGRRDSRTNRRRHLGYFMAFRTLLAQGPEMDGPAVCGGPCSKPTKPSRVDTTMFYELGLHWGR